MNEKKMICASWNVNGIRAVEKKGFIDILKKLNADIFAVQETKAQPEQLSDELVHIDGYDSYWYSAVKKGYSGLGIYSRIKPDSVIKGIGDKSIDDEGRVLTLEFDNFYFINCYFPNAQHELLRLDYKLYYDKKILKFCSKLKKQKAVLICGDFNVAHKEIDLKNPKSNQKNPGFTIEERQSMDMFLNSGFTDTFRMFNQEADNYTWWSYRFNARTKNIGWRIDYFCIDNEHKDKVKKAEILSDIYGSDHCPVTVELDI